MTGWAKADMALICWNLTASGINFAMHRPALAFACAVVAALATWPLSVELRRRDP